MTLQHSTAKQVAVIVTLWIVATAAVVSRAGAAPPAGDDIGGKPELPPLSEIHRQMRRSEELLRLPGTLAEAPAAQAAASAALAKWIAAARDAAPGSPAGGTSSSQTADAASTGAPDGDPSDAGTEAAPAPRPQLQRVWGHLPERLRTEMRAGGVERFLPKYEALIEQYYKRLAERDGGGP